MESARIFGLFVLIEKIKIKNKKNILLFVILKELYLKSENIKLK